MSLVRAIIGGVIGLMLGGPIGAVIGAFIFHQFGSGTISLNVHANLNEASQAQMAFLVATFSVMGKVAKVDGKVRPEAISYAKQVMDEMNLDTQLRGTAIHLFRQGKKADFQLEPVLTKFYQECQRHPDLLQRFLIIQLQTALADGVLSPAEDNLLWRIGVQLKISRFNYEQMKLQLQAQKYSYRQKNYTPKTRQTSNLAEAYRVLGLMPTANTAEVKQAYRRLMSQHHPDKLAAKGLSEAMMNRAKEKTQEISKAYETIQKQTKR